MITALLCFFAFFIAAVAFSAIGLWYLGEPK